MKLIKILWQLPQDIIGVFVILFSGAKNKGDHWLSTKYSFGVSLGDIIVIGRKNNLKYETSLKHEKGHQKQSLIFGPLYLIFVGLPSLIGNIHDRLFHKHWNTSDRQKWYYSRYPEDWADKLGNVNRKY